MKKHIKNLTNILGLFFAAMLVFGVNANAYIDPSVMTYMIQIVAGVVIAVGDGENFDNVETKMKVQVGDKVLFEKYAGTELKLEEKTYVVLRQIDIIGVFND